VSASDDNTLKLWNLETGTVVATFYGDAPYHCVSAASHDAIVAGDALGRIHVLSVTGQPAASTRPARGGA
jgi:hypothetical protein